MDSHGWRVVYATIRSADSAILRTEPRDRKTDYLPRLTLNTASPRMTVHAKRCSAVGVPGSALVGGIQPAMRCRNLASISQRAAEVVQVGQAVLIGRVEPYVNLICLRAAATSG